MSTTTATFGHIDEAPKSTATRGKSFYQRFIDARLRQGEAHAHAVLARMPDARLTELGFSAEQIRKIRSAERSSLAFWR